MELPNHNLNSLFEQLGLPATDEQIEEFISTHQLNQGCAIQNAPFWNSGQKQFLTEEHDDDADWVQWIDELDTLLHKNAMN